MNSCVSLCLSPSLSLSPPPSLSLTILPCMSVSLCLSLSLSITLALPLSLSLPLHPYVSLCVSLLLYLYLPPPLSLSLSASLRVCPSNENITAGAMAAVVFEVVLSGAGFRDMPRQCRRPGRGDREARRQHVAGPIVLPQDHRAPTPPTLQVLHMSDTPHFSTHTTTTTRPPRRSWLRGAQRHRATPTRCARSTGWPRRKRKR